VENNSGKKGHPKSKDPPGVWGHHENRALKARPKKPRTESKAQEAAEEEAEAEAKTKPPAKGKAQAEATPKSPTRPEPRPLDPLES
jgi:hypothetical protein